MNLIKINHIGFGLFHRRILQGMSSMFDLSGRYFVVKYAPSYIDDDNSAIASDWASVGIEIAEASDKFADEVLADEECEDRELVLTNH